jgi:hypothetical protein
LAVAIKDADTAELADMAKANAKVAVALRDVDVDVDEVNEAG